jgi:hypothetical protein
VRVPPEVDRFLRELAAVRKPELGIEPLSVEEVVTATSALWSATQSRVDLLPEEMGLIVLTAGQDPYGYGTRGAAAGKVIRYPHDATAEVAFSSLETFGRALRKAVETGTPIWDLPSEPAGKVRATEARGSRGPRRSASARKGPSVPTAQAFVDALAKAPLFAHVGEPRPPRWKAVAITSWKDALNGRRNQHKDNQHLEARNALTMFLSDHRPGDDRRWNDITSKWKPVVAAIVTPVCEELVRRERLPRSPLDDIRWDCLAACMEYEYADVRKPAFYHRLAGFYLAGHFPCGYDGWYPDGKHEIY